MELILFICLFFSISPQPRIYDPARINPEVNLKNIILEKKSIEIPFKLSDSNQILVEVCLGTPSHCYPFKVVTNINECFIFDSSLLQIGYDFKSSSTARLEEEYVSFEHAYRQYEGYVASDFISITGTNIFLPGFPFYVATKVKGGALPTNYIGVLGLGKKFLDYNFSLLSLLYINNDINHAYVSMFYKENGGILKIGFHDTSSKEYKLCNANDIDDGDPFFETTINAILYSNTKDEVSIYNTPQTIWFSPGASYIYCPSNFFNFLRKKIFKTVIEKNICILENIQNVLTVIKCHQEVLENTFGDLLFVFGKWSIREEISNLFINCGSYLCFGIEMIKGENKWILGYPFLKHYPIVFDYDNFKIMVKVGK